jgi:hypothetical protein
MSIHQIFKICAHSLAVCLIYKPIHVSHTGNKNKSRSKNKNRDGGGNEEGGEEGGGGEDDPDHASQIVLPSININIFFSNPTLNSKNKAQHSFLIEVLKVPLIIIAGVITAILIKLLS